ncbi:MAG: hypothetical protein K6G76_04535 [Lachnospiraceae bacterium]|nr:hypothetical protein [Lachnospiraceae bacterium]
MSEKLAEVYEQYDMKISEQKKGRGSTILWTDVGMRILEPFRGSMVRLEQEHVLKELLKAKGMNNLDYIIPGRDGQLITCDKYRQPYVLKMHYEGNECNMNETADVTRAVKAMADFHKHGKDIAKDFEVKWNENCRKKEERRVEEIRQVMEDGEEMERISYLYEISRSALEKALSKEEKTSVDIDACMDDVCGKFARHNTQIRKIGRFVSNVKRKNAFEKLYLKVYPDFYRQGVKCAEMLCEKTDMITKVSANHYGICHGSFNQHNVILCDGLTAIVHFERFSRGNQLNDLYQFARKVMEKNHFDFGMLKVILEEYSGIVQLDKNDYKYLYVLFSYPEKFWKIANSYYNTNKAFLSPKFLEKLETVILSEKEKQEMLGKLKNIVFEIV